MRNEIKISVIVPIYNCEQYLEKCIKSILAQTFEEFVLILIDDGSKDKSGRICDKYAKIDKRVITVHKENEGVSKAREKGLKMCNSEYVAFVDSDDYLKKDYLEQLYNNIIKYNSDFICCNSIDVGENLPKNICINKDEVINDKVRLLEDYFAGKRYAYCIWGKLFKRVIFKDIKFPKMKYAEDTCIILTLFMKCNKVALFSYNGYYYVQRAQSATFTNNKLQKANDILIRSELVNEICQKLNNKNLLIKAGNEMTESLYRAISANCCYADKKQFENFKKKYNKLYKQCINTNKIKFLIIRNFKLSKVITKGLFKFICLVKRNK